MADEKIVKMLIKSALVIRFIGLMFIMLTVCWIMDAFGFDFLTMVVSCFLLTIGLLLLSIANFFDVLDFVVDIIEKTMEEL